MFLTLTHVQVELLSGMGLGFQDTNGSAGSGTLTSSGTYLTTANFTGNGSFEAVVLPSLTNTTSCGSYSNPLIELAVLVTSLDATVCCCSCCAWLSHAVLGCLMLCLAISCCAWLPHAVLGCFMLCWVVHAVLGDLTHVCSMHLCRFLGQGKYPGAHGLLAVAVWLPFALGFCPAIEKCIGSSSTCAANFSSCLL